MSDKKKHAEKKKKQRALRNANRKRIKQRRKAGTPNGLQKALDGYEDTIQSIHAGWYHI